jgi:diguanylate cyclase (GGDEF)-like protein
VLLLAARSAQAAELVTLLQAPERNAARRPRIALIRAHSWLEAENLLRERSFAVILVHAENLDMPWAELGERLPASTDTACVFVGPERIRSQVRACGWPDFVSSASLSRELLQGALAHALERRSLTAALEEKSKQLAAALKQNALQVNRDPLTGLPNRRGLSELWTQLQKTPSGSWSACLLDLVQFREINRRFGHAVGDVVLREAARILRESLRDGDQLGRSGADEFLVFLHHTQPNEGRCVAERLGRSLEQTALCAEGVTLALSARIAWLPIGPGVHSLEELIRRAEAALCQPEAGPAHTPGLDTQASKTGLALAELCSGRALSHRAQQIRRLDDESLVGYEFLARSSCAGFEQPGDFFRLAAENQLESTVDRVCFELGLERCLALDPGLCGHLNLYPATLLDVPGERLLSGLPEGLGGSEVLVELSEQQLLGDPSYLVPAVQRLRAAGLRIGIDDVGFGRSCLESLVLLEPQVLKIDRRLVSGLAQCADQRRALKRLLSIADSLDCQVVAEGIETRADLAVLVEAGVERGQGFLFGPAR